MLPPSVFIMGSPRDQKTLVNNHERNLKGSHFRRGFEVRGSRFAVRGSRFQVRGTRFAVLGLHMNDRLPGREALQMFATLISIPSGN